MALQRGFQHMLAASFSQLAAHLQTGLPVT